MKIKNILVSLTAVAMMSALAVPAFADGVGAEVVIDPESTATVTNEDPGLAIEDDGEVDESFGGFGEDENFGAVAVVPVPDNVDDNGSPETGVNNSVLPALILMGVATLTAVVVVPKKSK